MRPLDEQPLALALPDLAVDGHRIPLCQERRLHFIENMRIGRVGGQIETPPDHFAYRTAPADRLSCS